MQGRHGSHAQTWVDIEASKAHCLCIVIAKVISRLAVNHGKASPMSLAFASLATLRAALARHDWQVIYVQDAEGHTLAAIARRSRKEILSMPNPHNLADSYRLATRGYEVTLYRYDRNGECHIDRMEVTGTPYAKVSRWARDASRLGTHCDTYA